MPGATKGISNIAGVTARCFTFNYRGYIKIRRVKTRATNTLLQLLPIFVEGILSGSPLAGDIRALEKMGVRRTHDVVERLR